jgi:hypothetical protein
MDSCIRRNDKEIKNKEICKEWHKVGMGMTKRKEERRLSVVV